MKRSKTIFSIQKLEVWTKDKRVVEDVSFNLKPGELHVLMGPNGSGKSSLTLALAGDPRYNVKKGKVFLSTKNILKLKPEDRAKEGLFLAFQHPVSLPGVSLVNFLRLANISINKERMPMLVWRKHLTGLLDKAGLSENFVDRDVNVGFSGGEQRRVELATLVTLRPRVALLDEIDSGLDVDVLKYTAKIIENMRRQGTAFILITHTTRLLKYLAPNKVYVLKAGKIISGGGNELLTKIDKEGFRNIKISNS